MTLRLSVATHLPTEGGKKLFKKAVPQDLPSHCLSILVDKEAQPLTKLIAVEGYKDRIDTLISASGFEGKLAETVADFALVNDPKKAPLQLVLVGAGERDKLGAPALKKIADTLYSQTHKRVETLYVLLGDALDEQQVHQFGLALLNASYQFDKYKAEKTTSKLNDIVIISDDIEQADLDHTMAVYSGQALARDLANEPGNICYPAYLAEQAKSLEAAYPDLLKVTVLGEEEMQALGMNSFLAVAHGSAREGQLVLLEYQGVSEFSVDATAPYDADQAVNTNVSDKKSPIVLVGKGVTFDSGGISIKPGAAMDEMKYDMGGAASAIGTIKALCEARLPINVVGALACAENMPSSDATRPGDIVTAMNGKTVEILNTDAEGRLVLADTLSYVQRYQPRIIVDVATLTGACVIALGHVRSAVYSNNEDVLFDLENASEQTGDLIWHMPMDEAYQTQLDSPFADMQNIGGRPAGSVTAACFLSRFVADEQPWAHLDIAGTAWTSGKNKAATGRPVPLFMRYLQNAAQK